MEYSVSEVLDFIEDNDVKFIRLAFCDLFGIQKNISIMPSTLKVALEEGIIFDFSHINEFNNLENTNLILKPDTKTISILPWRPQNGRVVRFFCDIKDKYNFPFKCDSRAILKEEIEKARKNGYLFKIEIESKFYLFKLDENGNPTKIPNDRAGYLDIAPLDKGENIRREVCLTLEEMGIDPENSYHEQGPGQNKIKFKGSNPLIAADNFITFKSVVKTVAGRNGLFASFMPKPLLDNEANELNIKVSLLKNDMNIIKSNENRIINELESFKLGVLSKIEEMFVFLNSTINSYKKFNDKNINTNVELICDKNINNKDKDKDYSLGIKINSLDSAFNPYIVFSLIINAGMQGIYNNLKLDSVNNKNIKDNSSEKLDFPPNNLKMAIDIARKSEFLKGALPKEVLDNFLEKKQKEWEAYSIEEDKYHIEEKLYFNKI